MAITKLAFEIEVATRQEANGEPAFALALHQRCVRRVSAIRRRGFTGMEGQS